MAPSRVGSISVVTTISQDANTTVTVPVGTDLALICFSAYNLNGMDGSTFTLGGTSAIQVVQEATDTGFNMGAIYRVNNPTIGDTETLAWLIENGISAGAVIYVVYYQDVDIAGGPIRGSGSGLASSGTATTGSFTSDTNDICLCIGADDGDDSADAGQSSQSEISSTNYGGINCVLGEKAGVSGSTTMRVDGTYAFVCGVSIRGTTGDLSVSKSDGITLGESVNLSGIQAADLSIDIGLDEAAYQGTGVRILG